MNTPPPPLYPNHGNDTPLDLAQYLIRKPLEDCPGNQASRSKPNVILKVNGLSLLCKPERAAIFITSLVQMHSSAPV